MGKNGAPFSVVRTRTGVPEGVLRRPANTLPNLQNSEFNIQSSLDNDDRRGTQQSITANKRHQEIEDDRTIHSGSIVVLIYQGVNQS